MGMRHYCEQLKAALRALVYGRPASSGILSHTGDQPPFRAFAADFRLRCHKLRSAEEEVMTKHLNLLAKGARAFGVRAGFAVRFACPLRTIRRRRRKPDTYTDESAIRLLEAGRYLGTIRQKPVISRCQSDFASLSACFAGLSTVPPRRRRTFAWLGLATRSARCRDAKRLSAPDRSLAVGRRDDPRVVLP